MCGGNSTIEDRLVLGLKGRLSGGGVQVVLRRECLKKRREQREQGRWIGGVLGRAG